MRKPISPTNFILILSVLIMVNCTKNQANSDQNYIPKISEAPRKLLIASIGEESEIDHEEARSYIDSTKKEWSAIVEYVKQNSLPTTSESIVSAGSHQEFLEQRQLSLSIYPQLRLTLAEQYFSPEENEDFLEELVAVGIYQLKSRLLISVNLGAAHLHMCAEALKKLETSTNVNQRIQQSIASVLLDEDDFEKIIENEKLLASTFKNSLESESLDKLVSDLKKSQNELRLLLTEI